MPIEQYQSSAKSRAKSETSYTIDYGQGWYIIERNGKVLKHVSSPAAMGLNNKDATLALTRETAVADIEYNRGVEG
jgi:hypothetical protein